MSSTSKPWYSSVAPLARVVLATVVLAGMFGGCAGHNSGGRELNIPEMTHVSPSRASALSVSFSGAESSLIRLPLEGPQGIEISGLPTAPKAPLIISSGYDYSIFCNDQRAPSRAKPSCRKNNPLTYSTDCDFPPGVSAKTTVVRSEESEIYCEITPFFWRAYCDPNEDGDEDARSHSHTYDGAAGCEPPDTQEVLLYLYLSDNDS